jgi:hypothetical protein
LKKDRKQALSLRKVPVSFHLYLAKNLIIAKNAVNFAKKPDIFVILTVNFGKKIDILAKKAGNFANH